MMYAKDDCKFIITKMGNRILWSVHMLTDDITDHLMHFYGKAIWDTVETNYPTMK